ncbi:hypothetical protein Pst134EA_019477 [Puccinia striiformis f. sp. tritici]|uniref:hypothetical protein n=1 Tax=Puccinia striiformis f. sp. tritici TaxID=168172 RepID=UPI002007447B|nr:hypothetical protein Pst134EA_019477 [Puccinia striiformis f. sp. tritici]KAH9459324.1 hypothetical protein Pst134EA_019477 [Puccinia striiformis f. sp. tritici]KAI9610641.1 hypothetical protein H4Q26_006788 [Puccinia striiformis f. sp. tritici PST-130]
MTRSLGKQHQSTNHKRPNIQQPYSGSQQIPMIPVQDRVDEERIWKITSELAQAVAFMHSSGVLHLDIKPANIFITAHGGLKLGDFGLARRWPRINPSEVRECGLLNGRHKSLEHVPANPSKKDNSVVPLRFLWYEDVGDNDERHMMRFKRCGRFVGFDQEREGDRVYTAPEILGGRYGKEVDVFSVGSIALKIATSVVLPDKGDEWRSLRSSDFSRTDLSTLSSELVLLIKRMMDKCPDRHRRQTDSTPGHCQTEILGRCWASSGDAGHHG